MGREVRMVPADWEHPKEDRYGEERYRPLYEGTDVEQERAEWDEEEAMWLKGFTKSYSGDEEWEPRTDDCYSYSEYAGHRPDHGDYMPDWSQKERTHYMMYETTSEGTPISPAFATPEGLARWLADNGASSFGSGTATYEQWLSMIKAEWAPSMALSGGQLKSGVEFVAND